MNQRMERVAEQKVVALLGLGTRARTVVIGVQQVRAAAARRRLALAVIANDASMNTRHKVVPLLTARGVEVIEGPPAKVLGAAVGKSIAAAVGVIDADLARGIRAAIAAPH
jgi:ribosomal protein L7Ae-like RNA K-turn-binding protein